MASQKIKVGTVTLTLYPWEKDGIQHWRFIWQDQTGKRRYTTRKTKADAVKSARAKAKEIHNSNQELGELDNETKLLVKAFLAMNPTWSDLEKYRTLIQVQSIPLEQAIEEFLAIKEKMRGDSAKNIKTLKTNLKRLKPLHGRNISEITKQDLDHWLSTLRRVDNVSTLAPRTQKNTIQSVRSLFYWAKKSNYLPAIGDTEAQKMEVPIVQDTAILTLSPQELRIFLENVKPKYAPWLILAAYAGIRHDELWLDHGSTKQVMHWDMINWNTKTIEVPKAVSKTFRRLIPLQPSAIVWLNHYGYSSNNKGQICTGTTPSKVSNRRVGAETTRLGKLIGGWKKNALRDSYISNRCSIIGIGKTAMEAGNSESVIKSNYLEMKTEKEANHYFNLLPADICGTNTPQTL